MKSFKNGEIIIKNIYKEILVVKAEFITNDESENLKRFTRI